MKASVIGELADEAAGNFLASLDAPATAVESEIISNAYAAGWIQGVYAGANEARRYVCKRSTYRQLITCNHEAKGRPLE